MSGIPKLFLRKMLVKNSCKNDGDNIIFQLRNPIGSGTVTEIFYLRVNDEDIKPDNVFCRKNGEDKETCMNEINVDNPYVMDHLGAVNFTIKEHQLNPGENKLDICFQTKEVGKVEFDVTVKA